jgi:hypothetical protein
MLVPVKLMPFGFLPMPVYMCSFCCAVRVLYAVANAALWLATAAPLARTSLFPAALAASGSSSALLLSMKPAADVLGVAYI